MVLEQLLQHSVSEKDVENNYKNTLTKYFGGKISSPFKCDGVLSYNNYRILLEFKYEDDFFERLRVSEILVQSLFYLKKFELHGEQVPELIFCGSKKSCFFISSSKLSPYLELDLNWNIAPSSAPRLLPELVKSIKNNTKIDPVIFPTSERFNMVFSTMKSVLKDTEINIKLKPANVGRYLNYFKDNVVKTSLNEREALTLFLGSVFEPNSCYLHPVKKNVVVLKNKEFTVNVEAFTSLQKLLSKAYSVKEKELVVAASDQFISDLSRRSRGEFFTPIEWSMEAHKLLEEVLGNDWRDNFIVWDPAWGTGNLTKHFKFKELYCSTLLQSDLVLAKNYNPEAVKFQYDFLNDDLELDPNLTTLTRSKLEQQAPGLYQALLEDKPLVIFMNPPFGASSIRNKHALKNQTLLIDEVKRKRNIKGVNNLFTKFLFRITLLVEKFSLSNTIIATFGSPTLISMASVENFRDLFFSMFRFQCGFMFNIKYFAGTGGSTAVTFNIWTRGKEDRTIFPHQIKDVRKLAITRTGIKNLYTVRESTTLKNSCRVSPLLLKGRRMVRVPRFSSSLKATRHEAKVPEDSLGHVCLTRKLWDVKDVVILSAPFTQTSIPVLRENFYKVTSAFCAQKAAKLNWLNSTDEFLVPEGVDSHPTWLGDSLVVSMLDKQSSLRSITFNDKKVDIHNHFFWIPVSDMRELANKHGFEELYYDSLNDEDRFLKQQLDKVRLSPKAKEVLEMATELVFESFEHRCLVHQLYPDLHLQCWDAGWYQIKKLLERDDKLEEKLKEFNNLFKSLLDYLENLVYELGFLIK